MASPIPAKSQPLHYFSLPQLKWKKNRGRRSGDSSPARSPITDKNSNKIYIRLNNKADESETPKTWNLRPRRPLHKPADKTAPKIVEQNKPQSPKTIENVEFSVSLSREEIEEDFFVLTGAKPSRRPKKRPRIVQKQLDNLFPGLWLGSITPEAYKVSEPPAKDKDQGT